jgi:phage baseplate assembly protein W
MAKKEYRSDKFLSRGYKDFSISFTSNLNTQDFNVVKNENAIKQSVVNLIRTGLGEKLFQPGLGSKINQMLFENFDPFIGEDIKTEIYNTLQRFEPRIIVEDIVLVDASEDNALSVTIDFRIIGEPLIQTVDFLLVRT